MESKSEYYRRRVQSKLDNLKKRKDFEEIYYESDFILDYLQPLNLTQRETDVILMYLFGMTQQETSKLVGVTRTLITRILNKVLCELRDYYTNGNEYDKELSGVYDISDEVLHVPDWYKTKPLDTNNKMLVYYES